MSGPFFAPLRRAVAVAIIEDGLIGRWPMDQSSGTAVPDASISGYDGVAVGIQDDDWVPGLISGNALYLDGSAGVTMGDVLGLNGNDPFTMCCHINVESLTEVTAYIHSKGFKNSPGRGYLFGIFPQSGGCGLRIILRNNTSPRYEIRVESTSKSLDFDEDASVACTYDGSTQASGMKLFKNGAEIGMTTVYDTLGARTILNSSSFNLGMRDDDTSDFPLNGILDEVRVYDRPLSGAELIQFHNGLG